MQMFRKNSVFSVAEKSRKDRKRTKKKTTEILEVSGKKVVLVRELLRENG